MVLVVVQPGDQLLSPERRTNTPQAAREDEVDSNTQSTSYLVSLGAWNSFTEETFKAVSVAV